MEKTFSSKEIEKKWVKYWQDRQSFSATGKNKKKKYILSMFPYPSGDGLHVGHLEGYTAADVLARYYRMKGYEVLHPMGWDAFGLPAENYAVKKGVHPRETTKKNIARFKKQLLSAGLSYDWSQEINTSSPNYYKWTQWIFIQLFNKGLAYQKEASVNWCNSCLTVLANEQVINGACDRCGNTVEQIMMKQWFFKITDYAERLLQGLDEIDWPESIKVSQRNWIGKSTGATINFKVAGGDEKIDVYTTRPDTLYGATYLVLAPEHEQVLKVTSAEQKKVVEQYVQEASKKTELQRKQLEKDKSGVFTGAYAINPVNDQEIPIYVADYVLNTYGTGSIMAVPAHDERDFEFAQKFKLDIVPVIEGFAEGQAYTGKGKLINSAEFSGQNSLSATKGIIQKAKGEETINYKLRDWLISRQRYWGAPIPIIHCQKCGAVAVEESDLPVLLPDVTNFKPKGHSPLADSADFVNTKCPKCQGEAKRETDTMDTFVCSSWYYLRYPNADNDREAFNKDVSNYWLPVDTYIGGAEHAVLHLLYARFFTKFFKDQNLLNFEEPFTKLRHVGLILGPDHQKMSKSKGNVINPDEVIAEYGADVLRLHELFMGPFSDEKPWNTESIIGAKRFVNRVYALAFKLKSESKSTTEVNLKINKVIKKVTEDTEKFHFNTAISSLMEFISSAEKHDTSKEDFGKFLILLSIYAPFVSYEAWQIIGNDKLEDAVWPSFDQNIVEDKKVNVAVQVNGRLRGSFTVEVGSTQAEQESLAQKVDNVINHTKGKKIIKIISKLNKIVNIVTD